MVGSTTGKPAIIKMVTRFAYAAGGTGVLANLFLIAFYALQARGACSEASRRSSFGVLFAEVSHGSSSSGRSGDCRLGKWCRDGNGETTRLSRQDKLPHRSLSCLVAMRALVGADGAKPLEPEPLSPRHSHLRPLARQYARRDKLCANRCVDCLASPSKPRGLARVPLRPRHQPELLQCRVRHLCPADTT
jgi:hypothetical protein